ncbi:MAG TPA: UvrD-helicase domain-containing protein, partial [Puia sp.]|nr:UvrD-helicase domain-containing protein [Puia sp.]
MTHIKYQPFDAAVVPLEGSNLIEASAGTGKTYSIAILVLRLVIEEQLSVKEILMVTFTRAAVAELEERIRLFIRTAYKASLGKPIDDPNIEAIVNRAIGRAGESDANGADGVRALLRESVLFLDETSVLTIHSFCKQALREFAFETAQLFGAETLPDMRPVVESALNQFWRQHVTTMDPQLLAMIVYPKMREGILELVLNHLSGRHYLGYENDRDYAIDTSMQARW